MLKFLGNRVARQMLWMFTQPGAHAGIPFGSRELPRHMLWALSSAEVGVTPASIDRLIAAGARVGVLSTARRRTKDGSDLVRMTCSEALQILEVARSTQVGEEVLDAYATAGVIDVAVRVLKASATRSQLTRDVAMSPSTITEALNTMQEHKVVEYWARGTVRFAPTERAAHRTLVATILLIEQALAWERAQRAQRQLEDVIGETVSPMVDPSLNHYADMDAVVPRAWIELTEAAVSRRESRETHYRRDFEPPEFSIICGFDPDNRPTAASEGSSDLPQPPSPSNSPPGDIAPRDGDILDPTGAPLPGIESAPSVATSRFERLRARLANRPHPRADSEAPRSPLPPQPEHPPRIADPSREDADH